DDLDAALGEDHTDYGRPKTSSAFSIVIPILPDRPIAHAVARAFSNFSALTIPEPSRTVTSWSAATFAIVSFKPFGQRISRSALSAAPRPECSRGRWAE